VAFATWVTEIEKKEGAGRNQEVRRAMLPVCGNKNQGKGGRNANYNNVGDWGAKIAICEGGKMQGPTSMKGGEPKGWDREGPI